LTTTALDTWLLPELERVSTTAQVLRLLREAIVGGRIAPGEQLREVRLAGALGVGRGVIREAIGYLVQEGLVEHELHRGAFVRTMNPSDGADLYFAREAIEVAATRRALDVDDLDLDGLAAALAALGKVATGPGRPSDSLIEADVNFHQALVDLAGSRRLSRAYSTFAAETQLLLRSHPPYPRDKYVGDHEQLYEALRRRDPQTPELVREHLQFSAQLIRNEIAGEGRTEVSRKRVRAGGNVETNDGEDAG
jgi:DNA-binding GntR family transcriptional regulator